MKTLYESIFDNNLLSKPTFQMKLLIETQKFLYKEYKLKVGKDYKIDLYNGDDPYLVKVGYNRGDDSVVMVIEYLKPLNIAATRSVVNDWIGFGIMDYLELDASWWEDKRLGDKLFIEIKLK